jgi:RNA polymerase sigma factor (sigma-70 family)
MFALRTLNRNISALQQLCIGLAAADVRVKRAPYLYNFNRIPIEDRVLIQTVFHPILVHHIAPEAAIRRLGYANVRLSKADRALLVDALERHQLSRSEERELFTEIARLGGSGIAAARPHVHQLINDNLWMVARIVRLYLGRGVPFADLFQEGVLGLYRAIDRFDLETGHRFMKYGGIWVRQVIMRAISDKARLIRLPVHVGERVQVLERTTLELEQGLQRTPTTTELAAALGTTPKRVGNLLRIIDPPLSLEGDGADLIDTLADSDPATDPEAAALQQTLCAAVCAMLALLPDRERRIIELRYGLLDDWDRTFEEVGQQIGVTRERIRQLEEKILRKLGSPLFGTHELERAWLKDSPAVNSTDTETHTKRRRSKKPAPADDPTDLKSFDITSEVTDGYSPAPAAGASLESKTHQLPSITLEREESSPANQLCDDVVAWQERSFGTETVAGQPAVTSLPIKRGQCKPRRNH